MSLNFIFGNEIITLSRNVQCEPSTYLQLTFDQLSNKEKGLIKPYQFTVLNPILTNQARASKNVYAFHNFLFEFDNLDLDSQLWGWQAYAESFPLANLIYSGNKSYHAIVSLADNPGWSPHTDQGILCYKTAWIGLARQVEDFFASKGLGATLDASTKDPARLFRTPNALRAETGNIQQLNYTGRLLHSTNLPKLPLPQYTQKASALDLSLNARQLSDMLQGADYAGIRTKLALLTASAAPHGFYTEIFKLSLWILETTGAPFEATCAFLDVKLFEALRTAGYEKDPFRGVKDAYLFKNLL